ncbi:MAG: hypothetical protein QF903_12765 [Planctomycetota bacterium]|jgi:hypothetical protein|nr:hypothetical protein [Planctomycetota bacterium]MDP6763603.1 hypothetical protein [Planctomycetota bacterium]MDP6990334.1 hypothetical protein [Planctomycetota bacterium]
MLPLILLSPALLCAATQGPASVAVLKGAVAVNPAPTGAGWLGGSDSCATPTPIAGEGIFPFDNSAATTGTEGQNESLCAGAGGPRITNDVWFEWTSPGSGTATLTTCNMVFMDSKVAVYPGSGCPLDGTALACNDDDCLTRSTINWPITVGATYTIQLGNWPGGPGNSGNFEITTDAAPPGAGYCFCDQTSPCGNSGAVGNGCGNGSNPAGANLTASGFPSVAADTISLEGGGAVPGQPGLFFQGDNAVNNGMGVFFGDGLRCAGMNVVRLQVVAADGNGDSQTSAAIAASGGVSAGDRRHYQLWYRDPAGSPCGTTFNLTNGLTLDWLP